MKTNFTFIYPLTKKNTGFTRLGDQIYNHVADLLVKGVAYITNASILNNISHQYRFVISEILHDGKNVYPETDLLEPIENINAACVNHIEQLACNPGPGTEE